MPRASLSSASSAEQANKSLVIDLSQPHRRSCASPSTIWDVYRRAASYVDQILKGTKASEIPIYLAVKFELLINMKAAKAIGLTIPPALLLLADEVFARAPALAADMPVKAPPPAPVNSWTGFYVGGNVGGSWGNSPTDIAGSATTVALPGVGGGFPGNNVFKYGTANWRHRWRSDRLQLSIQPEMGVGLRGRHSGLG